MLQHVVTLTTQQQGNTLVYSNIINTVTGNVIAFSNSSDTVTG